MFNFVAELVVEELVEKDLCDDLIFIAVIAHTIVFARGFEFVNEAEGLFFDGHILCCGIGRVVLIEILLCDAVADEPVVF